MRSRKMTEIPDLNTDEIPEPYKSIVKETLDKDTEWFQAHTGQSIRTRAYVWGEAWPKFPRCLRVTVMLKPGGGYIRLLSG